MISQHMYLTLLSYYFIVNCSIELNKVNPSLSQNQITTSVFPLDSNHGQ